MRVPLRDGKPGKYKLWIKNSADGQKFHGWFQNSRGFEVRIPD